MRPARTTCTLTILHIQVPAREAEAAGKIWNHLREDVLATEQLLRLGKNGFRIGIGHQDGWEPIKTAFDVIEGHRVPLAQPVRMLPGSPLALELDREPHDQTLFHVETDGVLSGTTWPSSRNVIRVTYLADAHDSQLARLQVVPEVRQRLKGTRLIRVEEGVQEVPNAYRRAFDAAGFALTLAPGEFCLIGPSASSGIYGMLGGAFLSSEIGATRYDSYVILKPEVVRVD